ncbi:MAG: phosphatase PAP2 family protein [Clostridia bacterium]
MNNFIYKTDYKVAEFFHNIYLWGGKFTNSVMEGISFIAEAGILFLIIGLGLAIFKRTRKVGATILVSVAIGFILTNILLKNIIERARPFSNIDSPFYKWWLGAGSVNESGYSFPSGHTTATTAFAIAIFLTTNKKHGWPILLLPILMASSRIYLMVHYFSDCLGGFIVGFIASVVALVIVKLIYKSNIKFFKWLTEFEIFKTNSSNKSTKSAVSAEQTDINSEDFVYSTQAEENTNLNVNEKKSNHNLDDNSSK